MNNEINENNNINKKWNKILKEIIILYKFKCRKIKYPVKFNTIFFREKKIKIKIFN